MNTSKLLFRGLVALCTVALMTGLAFSQNLVITGSGSFSGSGTYNVKGHINTSGASGAVSIPGTVNLNGSSATQQLGVSGTNALSFATLNATGSVAKQMDVNVTVSDALTVNITGALNVDVQAKTLNIGGTSTLTTGSLDVTDVASTVNYTQTGTSQVVLGLPYAGTLGMSGTSTKTLSAAASAGTLSHTGGDLTANNNLTVSGASTIGTLADVSATRALTLGTTATITTVTTNTGTITGGSGLTTISTLSGNAGTISGSGGGAITFTNAATNGGTITGGAGLVTFSNTLAHSTGTITAGASGVKFDGVVTTSSGTITAGTGQSLDINANVDNSGTSAISLTGTGTMTMAGNFTMGTGLSFASGSTVTFDGGNQNVPAATYGILNMSGTLVKTAQGNITAAGAFTNSVTTNMVTYALSLSSTKTNSGTMQFGGTGNGLLFTDGTVDYNGGAITQAVAGHAADKYATLLFTGGGTKQIAAATRVATTGSLTISSGVIGDVLATGQLLVDGNLTVNGTLSNAGTVQVGP